jgi:predicted RNase H-like HicB family nuclease
MIIRAILEWDEEAKSYSATCPELNHVSSCGDTETEAIENLKEAIQLFLEPIPNHFNRHLHNTIKSTNML